MFAFLGKVVFAENLATGRNAILQITFLPMTTFFRYACFEVYCRSVNGFEKHLSRPLQNTFEVMKFPVHGLPSLWEIAARAKNNEVCTVSSSLLRSFHIRLDRYESRLDFYLAFNFCCLWVCV